MNYVFNKLYIIESLRSEDMKTGELLYDSFRYNENVDELFDIEFQRIKDKYALTKYFEILEWEFKSTNILPFLQLEMHGNEIGIQLGSHEMIYWEEIVSWFERFNINTNNNLIVSLALCKGGYILSALDNHITKRAPFTALIYSFDEVKNIEIYKGFPNFYNSLFRDKDASVALNHLNDLIEEETRHFAWLSCTWLLTETFKYYLAGYSSGKTRNEVINKSLDNFRKYNSGKDFNVNQFRRLFKEQIKPENQEKFFEEVKNQYLMIDIEPKNGNRFPIKYNDILKSFKNNQKFYKE